MGKMNPKEIIRSWWRYYTKNFDKELDEKRLNICFDECGENRPSKLLPENVCNHCGCPLTKLTVSDAPLDEEGKAYKIGPKGNRIYVCRKKNW